MSSRYDYIKISLQLPNDKLHRKILEAYELEKKVSEIKLNKTKYFAGILLKDAQKKIKKQ